MDESKAKNEEPKVLLTRGEDGKLKAIAGEQGGKLKTVDPKKENADQFMNKKIIGTCPMSYYP